MEVVLRRWVQAHRGCDTAGPRFPCADGGSSSVRARLPRTSIGLAEQRWQFVISWKIAVWASGGKCTTGLQDV